MARCAVLALFLLLAQSCCADLAAPYLVDSSEGLVAALLNSSLGTLVLLNNVSFSPAFSLLMQPINITRNVSIDGQRFTLDLAHFANVLNLGEGVQLELFNMLIQNYSKADVTPGFDVVQHAYPSSSVLFNDMDTELGCCLPPSLWGSWARSFVRATGVNTLVVTTPSCPQPYNCSHQVVTMLDFVAEVVDGAGNSFSFIASGFQYICQSLLDKDCVFKNGADICLHQCQAAMQASMPPQPGLELELGIIEENAPPYSPLGVRGNSPVDPGHSTATVAIIGSTLGVTLLIVMGVAFVMVKRRGDQGYTLFFWKKNAGPVQDGKADPDVGATLDTGSFLEPSHPDPSSTSTFPSNSTSEIAVDLGSNQMVEARHLSGSMQTGKGSAGTSDPNPDRLQEQGTGSKYDPVRHVRQLADELQGSAGDKLVLMDPIGKGAFGTVYRGRWRNMDVAVKTMLFSERDGVRQDKAVMEAALASSVVHTNVVCVYHYDVKPVESTATHGSLSAIRIEEGTARNDWKMFLVQELCQSSVSEGLDQSWFHDPSTGMPRMDLILSVLMDIALGMGYIHSKKIIHGDLKPENVLMKLDPVHPHGFVAKIADFGMSATLSPGQSHISNFNKGTPFYIAPEVLLSQRTTPASDVFSFGVILQQVLTCKKPWVRSVKRRGASGLVSVSGGGSLSSVAEEDGNSESISENSDGSKENAAPATTCSNPASSTCSATRTDMHATHTDARATPISDQPCSGLGSVAEGLEGLNCSSSSSSSSSSLTWQQQQQQELGRSSSSSSESKTWQQQQQQLEELGSSSKSNESKTSQEQQQQEDLGCSSKSNESKTSQEELEELGGANKSSELKKFQWRKHQQQIQMHYHRQRQKGDLKANPDFWTMPQNMFLPFQFIELRNSCLDRNFRNRPSFDEIFVVLSALYTDLMTAAASCQMGTPSAVPLPGPSLTHQEPLMSALAAAAASQASVVLVLSDVPLAGPEAAVLDVEDVKEPPRAAVGLAPCAANGLASEETRPLSAPVSAAPQEPWSAAF